jgi:CDP-diglyceride synthetase
MRILYATRLINYAACLLTAIMLVYSADGLNKELSWWFGASLFAFWGFTPYVALGVLANRSKKDIKKSVIILIGMVVTAATAAYIYYDGFFRMSDTTWSGLLFVVVPMYQWVEVLFIALFAYVIERFSNPEQNES